MRVAAEPGTPVVRLDDEGFEAVLAAAAGRAEPTPDVAAVLARPELVGPLTAAFDPLVRVELTIASGDLHQVHRGWFTPEDGLLLLGVRRGVRQLQPLAPAVLAVTLARLVRLGPRQVGERTPRPAAASILGRLTDADSGVRAEALRSVAARYAWSLMATWDGGERHLVATDGDDGLWILEGERLVPVTATFVYRLLTTLLPTDAELEPEHHGAG